MIRRPALRVLCFLALPCALWPTSLLEQGEKLLLDNKLREAGAVFEQALGQGSTEEKLFLYLGVIYEQLGDPLRAVAVMQTGLLAARQTRPLLCFNIGNNLFRQGDYAGAQSMYTQAISLDPSMADAYLNRANTRLESSQYPEAMADYAIYLRLDPRSPQRPQIERLLAAIKAMLSDQELARAEAAARQKALMDDVLKALRNASSDSKNIGADSEKVNVEFESSSIED
jgi:tetratricopeptide (TPR) repeat protein